MNKIFSIIIPTYNVEKKIAKTLDSVISQDKDLYECIIVDGNSTDNTVKVVEEYKKKFPENIRYISEPDKGIYDAMNKGIDLAKGEYLYFLGAGDTLKYGILNQVKLHLNFEKELVYGEVLLQQKGYSVSGEFDKLRICFANLPHQAEFYHKSVFNIIGKYNLNYPIKADYDINLKCFGDDNISKRYIDLVVANYEGNGISDKLIDGKLEAEKGENILKILGRGYYHMYKLYNSYKATNWWVNKNFIDYININTKINIAIFGSGDFGKNVFKFIKENNKRFNRKVNVSYFFDNDDSKWNKILNGKNIFKPNIDLIDKVDKVIIASVPGRKSIAKQLLCLGVYEEKLIVLS